MPKRLDLTDQVFGRLKVISFDHVSRDGGSYWLCECGCQDRTRIVVRGYDLKHGHTVSCGCLRRESNNITGRMFGCLKVLGLDHITERGRTYWLCECSCEDRTRVVVRRDCLISGATLSCGCLQREINVERLTRHGLATSRLYKIWSGMRQRCENDNNPRYSDYGGRGISVSSDWDRFENFHDWSLNHGYTDKSTIDRKDNDQGYSPENCRWTNQETQQNNTRRSRYFTYESETKTLADWTKCLGVKYSTLWHRIARGDLHDFEEYFNNSKENT